MASRSLTPRLSTFASLSAPRSQANLRMSRRRFLPDLELLACDSGALFGVSWPNPSALAQALQRGERDGRLPARLASEIRSAGFQRLVLSRSLGGLGWSLPKVQVMLESLASRSGSLAWVVMSHVQSPVLLS